MKNKRIFIPIMILAALLLILFLPIPKASYDDGGTREYVALTYKIVRWKRLVSVHDAEGDITQIDTYKATSVFWFPDNLKSIDELWNIECERNAPLKEE